MLAGTMDEKTATVAAIPMFAKLEPRSLEAVATLAKIVSVPADTVLVREGEPAESFYVIVSGTVHIERARPVRPLDVERRLPRRGRLDRGRHAHRDRHLHDPM